MPDKKDEESLDSQSFIRERLKPPDKLENADKSRSHSPAYHKQIKITPRGKKEPIDLKFMIGEVVRLQNKGKMILVQLGKKTDLFNEVCKSVLVDLKSNIDDSIVQKAYKDITNCVDAITKIYSLRTYGDDLLTKLSITNQTLTNTLKSMLDIACSQALMDFIKRDVESTNNSTAYQHLSNCVGALANINGLKQEGMDLLQDLDPRSVQIQTQLLDTNFSSALMVLAIKNDPKNSDTYRNISSLKSVLHNADPCQKCNSMLNLDQ